MDGFLHPVLFLIASLLFAYRLAGITASPDQLLRPILVLSLAVVALFGPAWWLRRRTEWAAILVTVIVWGRFPAGWFFLTTGLIACGRVGRSSRNIAPSRL